MTTFYNATGFEAGSILELLTSTSPSIQSSIKRSGQYALRINPTGTGIASVTIGGITGNSGAHTNLAIATLYYRFYFRWEILPSSNNEPIFQAHSVSALKFGLRINSLGQLMAYASDGSTQIGSTGATQLQQGKWYRIEAKVGTGTDAEFEILLNGNVEISGTGNLTTGNNATGRFGKIVNRNGNSVDFYYDDIALADDYPGPGRVGIMLPDNDGAYTAWTIGAGSGDKWEQVKDVPFDEDTSYLLSTLVSNEAYTAALESASEAGIDGVINAIVGMCFAKGDTGSGAVRMRVRSGTTNSDTTLTRIVGTAAYLYFARILNDDPHTSEPWTAGGLDGLEVGMIERETSIKTRLTAAYAMVDYNPPGPEFPEEGGPRTFAAVIG